MVALNNGEAAIIGDSVGAVLWLFFGKNVTEHGPWHLRTTRQTNGSETSAAWHKLSNLFTLGIHQKGGDRSAGRSSPLGSESEDDKPQKRWRLHPNDMAWYNWRGEQSFLQNPSCSKSASLIRKFNQDIKSAKLFIILAPGASRGVPMLEWEHIFKGEAIDLNKILSSLHCVSVDMWRHWNQYRRIWNKKESWD